MILLFPQNQFFLDKSLIKVTFNVLLHCVWLEETRGESINYFIFSCLIQNQFLSPQKINSIATLL